MARGIKDLFSDILFILLFVEWILCLVGVIMLAAESPGYYNVRAHDLTLVAVGGYLLITSVFIIVYIFDETHKMLEMIFWGVGGILNIVAGILIMMYYSDRYGGGGAASLIIGITSLACGVLMIISFILLIRK